MVGSRSRMAQYVMEFTSGSVETALRLLDRLVSPKTSLQTLSCAEQDTLQYRPSEGELAGLLPDLIAGSLCSVMVHSEGEIRYGLLTCPRFNGQQLSSWMGTIEFGVEAWRPVWNQVLKDSNVAAVCVGMEEGIDLADSMLTAASFPWNDPSLVAGAVRQPDGTWDVREPEP
jgi:hypothetical protein